MLDIKSKVTGKSKAEIARKALEEGLSKSQPKNSNSAKALLALAKEAEGLTSEPKLLKNLSSDHDLYAWGNEANE